MKGLSIILFTAILNLPSPDGFKDDQERFSRVRTAYAEKEAVMLNILQENSIAVAELEIYLRVFKSEQELELWGKNKSDDSFKLLKTYEICRSSGGPGPKRRQGDLQVPEGFYHINIFNPTSSFYLSLGINYPNKSDRILSNKKHPGGDIYIHGDCVTIGCVPITDGQIKELYIFCVEAKDKGQKNIPVTIFPARLEEENFKSLKADYSTERDKVHLWSDLKIAYDLFEQRKQLPSVTFLDNGRHKIN